MVALDKLLAANGRSYADLQSGRSRLASRVKSQGLRLDDRIAALRERDDYVEPHPSLRPAQVEALRELVEMRGLFGALGVGAGKTLLTMLAAPAVNAKRPMLLIPASLREKTQREFIDYRTRGWDVVLPKIVSYEGLSTVHHADALESYRPDLLIADEAHRLKNRDAACTRRVERYLESNSECLFVALSGSMITERFLDYWHLLVWALRENAPVPIDPTEAQNWASALDEDVADGSRIDLGELTQLGDVHEFVRSRRGVVVTVRDDGSARLRASIYAPDLPSEILCHIESAAEVGIRPDGELLDPFEIPNVVQMLALGFYHVWDPMPPREWLDARRDFASHVRDLRARRIDGLDSPLQIAQAIDRGEIEGRELLEAWRAVKRTFEPNSVPVWIAPQILDQIVEAAGDGCLIWTRFRAVADRIGVPYYGAGTNPEDARGETICLSIAAHGTGRNLQHYYARNLVLTPPAKADRWEQMIGRTDRAGQRSEKVEVAIYAPTNYHKETIDRAVQAGKIVEQRQGQKQKIVILGGQL
jgi:hypothetical protein